MSMKKTATKSGKPLRQVWGDYCGWCGGKNKGETFPKKCANGHTTFVNNLPVSVPVQPVRDEEGKIWLLAVRRNINPGKGGISLPGGFVENGETPALGAQREMREETGVVAISSGYSVVAQAIVPAPAAHDPRNIMVEFVRLATLDKREIDFSYTSPETQEVLLLRYDAQKGGIVDFRGNDATLCFSTHQRVALEFLSHQAELEARAEARPQPRAKMGTTVKKNR